MCHAADEVYDVYDETFPRARKEHQCSACRETIAPGQRYARVGIVFQKEAETVVRCLRCQRIHEHLRDLAPGDLWPDEHLNCGQKYHDTWGTEPPEEIAKLAFALPGEVT